MSAGIVYDGVTRGGTENKYEGTLFNGLKFFILQKVPARNSLLDDLKSNGGKIVLLENKADVLVGDDARTDVPPGFVSWKFVKDCIRKGELCNKEEYLINHAKTTSTAKSKSAKAKRTEVVRNRFTEKDNEILIKYVLQQEREGKRVGGNGIYNALAEKYPHHTSQSWRDRWVKYYKFLPREDLPYGPHHDNGAVSPPRPRIPRPVPSAATLQENKPVVTSSAQPQRRSNSPKRRVAFSEEDDRILEEYVRARMRGGLREKGNKIYIEFAEDHPHHSYQSWRDRWVRILSKREASPASSSTPPIPPVEKVAPAATSNVSRGGITREAIAGTRTSQPSTSRAKRPVGVAYKTPKILAHALDIIQYLDEERRISEQPPADPIHGTNSRPAVPRDSEETEREEPQADVQRNRGEVQVDPQNELAQQRISEQPPPDPVTSHRSPSAVPRHSEDTEIEQLQAHTLQNLGQSHQADLEIQSSVELEIKCEPEDTAQIITPEEADFKKNFTLFCNTKGSKPIQFVDVDGKIVTFWDLWSVATEDNYSFEDRDWNTIAAALARGAGDANNFRFVEWAQRPDVPGLLKSAFEKHLLEFESLYRDYEEGSDSDEDTEEEDNGDGADLENPISATAATFRSSPPVSGFKRTFEQAEGSPELGLSPPPAKRRRFSNDDEIPCSPEIQHRTLPPSSAEPDAFPSPQRLPLLIQQQKRAVEPETQDFLPPLNQQQKRTVEPETQDFNFADGADDWLGGLDDPTPDQQLLSDMLESVAQATPPQSLAAPSEAPSSDDAFDLPVEQPPIPRTRTRQLPWNRPSSRSTAASSTEPVRAAGSLNHDQRREHRRASLATTADPEEHPLVQAGLRFVALGYEHRDVSRALKACTYEEGLAGHVMESLKQENRIPTDMAGVWTYRDDADLKLVHKAGLDEVSGRFLADDEKARMLEKERRLMAKHGAIRMQKRIEFFEKSEREGMSY